MRRGGRRMSRTCTRDRYGTITARRRDRGSYGTAPRTGHMRSVLFAALTGEHARAQRAVLAPAVPSGSRTGITARAGWLGGQPLAIHLASRAPLREGAWHGAALHAHGGYLGIGPRPGGAGGPDSKQGDVPGQLHCEREGCQGCMAEATCGWSVREATPLHRAHAARSPLGCSGRSSASTRDDTLCSRVCGWRFDCGFETLRS